ncbi:MAG: aminobutyraldehyde dehydrogenase [Nitrospira bacterium SG8_35_4]|nr:MAG: aminobutyraldehyde dehydrogenase [Nitrospira bacterium SG8_35_4]
MTDKAEILICGGGIIGLTLAKELSKQGYKHIVILEKEKETGKHASGRNSGVLHAGIYYTRDSLKAKLCLKGNHLMKNYCREKNIPVYETGKVIVAKNEGETKVLEELYQRALNNGAKVELFDERRLKSLEPFARTFKQALFSPETAVIKPQTILDSIEKELIDSGKVKILKDLEFRGIDINGEALTSAGKISFDLFVNAAGAYSDKIAHLFGTGQNYKILPFRGTYRKLIKEKSHLVNGNIYPVPDIRNPFLGIHFTKVADGTVYIGPTAIPAFGRENYEFFKGVDKELFQILVREGVLFFKNAGFRKVAVSEPGKYFLRSFFEEIKDMIHGLNIKDILPSNKAGIRPQLVDWHKKELVMDFVVLKHKNSIHILNAVSPAFTSSMAFAEFVVEKYIA